ncbi:MAG: alkaline phosphatase D family protein [Carbonactinosporaceae bacterium]
MARLVVGPLLRHVDETSAAVWVETDVPCLVGVLGATTYTFTVHGHHYALVEVEGLTPGSSTRYTVELDGEPVWPDRDSGFPASRIRTLDRDTGLRLVVGSCRTSAPHDADGTRAHGVDALRAYALRMTGRPEAEWPSAAALLGDQVYADLTSGQLRHLIRRRRDVARPPGFEVTNFEEYTHLYRLAWTDPAIRWLLSTIPSMMIFDDHDIRDDWNTSHAWRARLTSKPWWRDRIIGGIGAYWLYQHLGNLGPKERATDPILRALRRAAGDGFDGGPILDELAWRADRDPSHYRWSYARDLGSTRMVVLDTRCGRVLQPGRRSMFDERGWEWFEAQARGAGSQPFDHLLIGSSLPVLLPRALHHLEAWNEAVCAGAWGRRAARLGERLRQAIDLEHWAAFGGSFARMAGFLHEVATGRRGHAPASVILLSGDVHYSYLARGEAPGCPIHQVVCSPMRNPLPRSLRWASGMASRGPAALAGQAVGRLAGMAARVPALPMRWRVIRGPWYHNAIATLEVDGQRATVRWEAARRGDAGALHELGTATLAGAPGRGQAPRDQR